LRNRRKEGVRSSQPKERGSDYREKGRTPEDKRDKEVQTKRVPRGIRTRGIWKKRRETGFEDIIRGEGNPGQDRSSIGGSTGGLGRGEPGRGRDGSARTSLEREHSGKVPCSSENARNGSDNKNRPKTYGREK